jgi:hypothetical protein
MSKKDKTVVKEVSPEEQIMKDAVEKVNAVLKETGTVLQPFLDFQEYGVVPRVRIVLPKKEDVAKTI